MANGRESIEFENERVRVIRVKLGSHEKRAIRAREDRVIIWLTDSHHARSESNGKRVELRRKAGAVAWRAASEHEVENLSAGRHEVIIVELKK